MSRFASYQSAIVSAEDNRNTGPSYDHWPRTLPQVSYVVADGGFLCVVCANGGNGSLASTDTETDDQWRIIGAQVNTGDTPCDHCGRIIRG